MSFARSVFIILATIFPLFAHASEEESSRTNTVVVSIAPYKFFVEHIAGNAVKVAVLVPSGASFHSFEPAPRQILEASKSDIWFQVGETFESRAAQAFKSANPQMRFVDLRKGVDLITVSEHDAQAHGCTHAGCADLHIWLSPIQSKIQAKTIAEALISVYPEHKEKFQKNLEKLLKNLGELNQDIIKVLQPVHHRVMMVSHPAYAYFARDYHFEQLPIEFEGREPTPRQLESILSKARQNKIKAIFVQKQYGMKAAQLVAKEIGARVVVLDPYGEHYFTMMREIAMKIAAESL